jgi:hypothetical protein
MKPPTLGRWFFSVAQLKSLLVSCADRAEAGGRAMKRLAVWILYAVGVIAIGYLALYAYAAFTGRQLQPGDPIHIFRRPDAPSYS